MNREIHYHVKVEIEKKTLERQPDFNTVAVFTVLDCQKYGYLDFETFRVYMSKFKKDIKKPDINSIIRRLDYDADQKITFNEFAIGITPEYPGLEHEPMEFNQTKKEEIMKQNEENKKTNIKDLSPSPLRDFRAIYSQEHNSPVKQEFRELKLKQNKVPEHEYLMDLRIVRSPNKKASPRKTDRSEASGYFGEGQENT